jgi:[protein-PII] uridylyltransferase
LLQVLESVGRGEAIALPERRVLLERPSPFTISPTVAIDNDASHHATVIEASGRDRPGLLEALARALSKAKLSIQSAHIDNYGERAVDAFYVVTAEGSKLTDPARGAAVRGRLIEVLEASEAAPRDRRLSTARASSAR